MMHLFAALVAWSAIGLAMAIIIQTIRNWDPTKDTTPPAPQPSEGPYNHLPVCTFCGDQDGWTRYTLHQPQPREGYNDVAIIRMCDQCFDEFVDQRRVGGVDRRREV